MATFDPYQLAKDWDWVYIGDINPLDRGGIFYKLDASDLKHGYCEVIEITGWADLEDDNKGAEIRTGSVYLERKLSEWRSIYNYADVRQFTREASDANARKLAQVDACKSYWGIDSYNEHRTKREAGLEHLLRRLLSR